MKIALLLVLLACVELASAGTLVIRPRGPFSQVIDPTTCATDVDYYVRSRYDYYLINAQLCYVAHIDYRGGFLYIHQYRNYIGTFMAISRYSLPQRQIGVVTFVRLGDGAPSLANLFEPINIHPFAISIDLGYGEYRVPRWGQGETPNWSESWAQRQFYQSQSAADAAADRCSELDHIARSNYGHYLRGAATLSASNSAFGSYCYCMNTYVNQMGIWQVIGTSTPFGVQISTFVRLGDGYDPKTVQPCVPYPAFNTWHF